MNVRNTSIRFGSLLSLLTTAAALTGCTASSPGSSNGGDQGSNDSSSVGTVTFRMLASSEDAGTQYQASFSNPGDGIWWYSVATQGGTPLQIFSTLQSCAACGVMIPIGMSCSSIPDGGITATWDGFALTGGTSTCSGSTSSCEANRYMPAGDYVVTMCGGCAGLAPDDAGTDCVSVPFTYPTSSDVVGTLKAP